jgi:hypothetical protein
MADAEQVAIGTALLKCQVCTHDRFLTRTALLNTAGASFFGFDWANRSATCYVCESCGYVHWFLRPDQ